MTGAMASAANGVEDRRRPLGFSRTAPHGAIRSNRDTRVCRFLINQAADENARKNPD